MRHQSPDRFRLYISVLKTSACVTGHDLDTHLSIDLLKAKNPSGMASSRKNHPISFVMCGSGGGERTGISSLSAD